MKSASSFLFDWLVYIVSHLIPKNDKVWVFWGWHTDKNGEIFADNSKYFFLHVKNNNLPVHAVWLTRFASTKERLVKNGLECYLYSEPRGAWYALTAGFTIIDGLMNRPMWRHSGRSRVIQLWHGKGMKKGLYQSKYNDFNKQNKFVVPQLFRHPDRLVASSDETAKLMTLQFREPVEHMMVTGLPRNDVLLRPVAKSDIDLDLELKSALDAKKSAGKSIIWYAPTFRPDGKNPLDATDWNLVEKKLEELDIYLLITLHPKFANKEHVRPDTASRIIYGKPGYDMYPLFHYFDMLITDYSSSYIDFLILDRPITFYDFDIEKYRDEMGLQDDYDEMTRGSHPKNTAELISEIESNVKNDPFKSERAVLRKKLHAHIDANASERLAKILMDMIK